MGLILNTNYVGSWDDTNAFRGGPPVKLGRLYVQAYAGDSYSGGIAAAPADTDPPTLSSIHPLGFVTNSVVLFNTDIPANCGIMFGTSSGVYSATNFEQTAGGTYLFTPGTWGQHWSSFNSTAGTTYFFRVIATNTAAGGGIALSGESTLTGNAWSPTNRPNVKVVYDVNLLGLSAGTTISSLTDFSADAWHGRQVGTVWASNNAVELNNHSFMRTPGSGANYFTTNFTVLNQPNTIYMVMRPQSVASQPNVSFPFFYDSANVAAREALYEKQNSGAFISEFAGTDVSTPTTPLFQWYYWENQYNGASSFSKTNGVVYLSGNAGAGNLGGITIGNNNAFNQPGLADFAFFAIVNAANSASESADWQTYLINRFGRRLPP
jgi:hypothetical protein